MRQRGTMMVSGILCVGMLGSICGVVAAAGSALAESGGERAGLRSFVVPGSEAVVTLWEERSPGGETSPWTAISLDGRTIDIERPVEHRLGLRYGHFDPLVSAPFVPDVLKAPEGSRIFLVQYETQPIEAYRSALESLGVTLHAFFAPQAWIVEMEPQRVAQVADLPFVRWVGQWHPAYKIDPGLLHEMEEIWRLTPSGGASSLAGHEQEAHAPGLARIDCPAHGPIVLGADRRVGEIGPVTPGEFIGGDGPEAWEGGGILSIMVWERGLRLQNRVAQRIEQLGGIVVDIIPEGYRLRARMTPEQLLEVLRMDEVWFVDLEGVPGTDMDIVREIGGANYIENTLGFTGQGVRGSVFDSGLRVSHGDWKNTPIIHSANGSSTSHGTAVYGVVFGDGSGDPTGRGMLPDAQGIFTTYNVVGGRRYQLTEELVDPTGPYRAVFQTNSWGAAQTTQYTTISAEMDDIVFLYDIVVTQSQSNTGDQRSRPQAWAKNVGGVGGVRHYDNPNKSAHCWCNGASIGPASDGRVNPEFIHFYDMVWTTSSSCDTCYRNFSGTSSATPITVGHFGLMFQMWHEGVFDGFGGGNDVFDSRPGQATARALMHNSTEQYPFSSPAADLSRAKQGWGMADVKRLYDMADQTFIVNESEPLRPLETHEYRLTVEPGLDEFRASLVYKDLMGNPSNQSMHRINKLNLRVTAPDNTVYWGNNGMWNGNWTVAGGAANTIDTAENVFLPDPMAGEWLVEVIGTDIVEDQYLATPEIDAVYALVVSGVTAEPGFTLSTSGSCPGTVTVSWENAPANETLGLIFALNRGNFVIPQPMTCAGTRLGLGSRQIQLVTTFNSGANGSGSHRGSAGPGACSGSVQLIDAGGCTTSNVASMP